MTTKDTVSAPWCDEDFLTVTDADFLRLQVTEEDWARLRIDEHDLAGTQVPPTQEQIANDHGNTRQKTQPD